MRPHAKAELELSTQHSALSTLLLLTEAYMKILIAVDGSEGSENAVNAIAANPLSPGTEVRVLSVIESPYVPTPETWALPETYFTEMEKAAQEQAQSAVNAACGRLAAAHGTNATISMSVVNGHPKEAILDEAEKWMADLIVLGSHGYRGWQRFLLGSVSQAVASHANCSVEIVRRREARSE